MKRWAMGAGFALAVVGIAACGSSREISAGHVADIQCESDGAVHYSASLYGSGSYSIDGGATVPFQGGFSGTLPGTSAHTLTITAPDWPTFSQSAGPCVQPTTIPQTAPPTTGAATTTTCPDCTINTVVITATTAPTSTTIPTSTTGPTINTTVITPPPGGTTTTSSSPPGVTTTTCPTCVPAATTTTVRPPTGTSPVPPSPPPGSLPPTR